MHVTDEAAAEQFIAAANAFRMQKMGRMQKPQQHGTEHDLCQLS